MMPIERRYRETVNRLAFALLIFEGLFFLMGAATGVLSFLTDLIPNIIAADITYELVYGLLYAAIFILPVFFFRLISKGKPVEPMHLERRLPRETALYIFAAVAVITAAAYVNSYMVEIFHYGAFSDEVLWSESVTSNYQLVLMVFTTAVVPAFVEEFLFRGLILSNLQPYGRVTAVVASAFLFGLMHQNAGQFFYAAAAGLVIGFVYVKTKSLWVCILIHFVNNFISVIQTVLAERLSDFAANMVLGLMQGTVFALGLVSAVILMLRIRDRRGELLAEGCFEREVPADPEYVSEAFPFRRRVKLFFSAPMIVFVVLCGIQMLSLLAVSALMY